MEIKAERTLFRVGEDSFAITLPKEWIRHHLLQHGDRVNVVAGDKIVISAKADEKDEKS